MAINSATRRHMIALSRRDEDRLKRILSSTMGRGGAGLDKLGTDDLCILFCHFQSFKAAADHCGLSVSGTKDAFYRNGVSLDSVLRWVEDNISNILTAENIDLGEVAMVDPSELERALAMVEYYKRRYEYEKAKNQKLSNGYNLYRDIIATTVTEFPAVPAAYQNPTSDYKNDEELCFLPISDTQIGSCVLPERLGGLAHYNWDVFLHRIEEYKRGVNSIVNEHLRLSYPINTAVVMLLGDICLPSGSPITMADGTEKPIEDVAVGDAVMTHTSSSHVVTETMSRFIDEDISSFMIYGNYAPIRCTGNHPVLSITREQIWDAYCSQGRSDRGQAVATNIVNGYSVKKHHWDCVSEKDIRFNRADSLRVGDYVAIPADYIGEGETVMLEMPTREQAIVDVPDKVELDCDLARILGYYAAEGWCSDHGGIGPSRVVFSMGCPEAAKERIEDLQKVLADKFGVQMGYCSQTEKKVQITVADRRVAMLFAELCGTGPMNKRAPIELLARAGRDVVFSFLVGYFDCDGYRYDTDRHKGIETVSVSEQMIRDAAYLCYGVGIQCSINYLPLKGNDNDQYMISIPSSESNEIMSMSVNPHEFRTITKSKSRKTKIGKYWLVPIIEVAQEHYTGKVFNFEVEDDHSYVSNWVALHNCEGETVFPNQIAHLDLDLTSQIFNGVLQIAELIRWLAAQFKHVRVLAIPGNHGNVKGTTMNADYIAYIMMAQALAAQPNVEFMVSETHYLGFYIDKNQDYLDFKGHDRVWNFLMTHGHQAKSYNSLPFYSLERLVRRYSSMTGILWDKLFVGHHHQDVPGPRNAWAINGSWVGGTEYSQEKMQGNDQPCQRIWGFHPKRGLTWTYSIDLDKEMRLEMRANDNGVYTPVTTVSIDEKGATKFNLAAGGFSTE